jgi:hypothetical protein
MRVDITIKDFLEKLDEIVVDYENKGTAEYLVHYPTSNRTLLITPHLEEKV